MLLPVNIDMNPINKPACPPSLDGITLEAIVIQLSVSLGWEALAAAVPVRCFSPRSQHQIQPEILTQNTVGTPKSGAVVFATSSHPPINLTLLNVKLAQRFVCPLSS